MVAGELIALVAVAFVGGAVGAAIGAYRALGVSGALVAVDTVGGMLVGGGRFLLGTGAPLGYGPALGPHVLVGGGAAATAYAARKGQLESGFRFHESKNVTHALGLNPMALFVGGVFGAVGLGLARLSVALSLPWEPLAASLVLSAFLHRLVLGYPAVGAVRDGLLDMTPYERGEQRRSVVDGSPTRRPLVEPWLPGRYQWSRVAGIGILVGAVAGGLSLLSGSAFLAYGLAAAPLVAFEFGEERFPVVHHVALVAGLLVVGLVGAGDPPGIPVTLLAGAGIGLVTALAAQGAQRAFYAHADTHFDPPAAGILVGSFLVAVLDVLGVVQQGVVPTPF